jgi:hypothetical protein
MRLSQWGADSDDGYISDSNIAAVALLAGYEVFKSANPCMSGMWLTMDLASVWKSPGSQYALGRPYYDD